MDKLDADQRYEEILKNCIVGCQKTDQLTLKKSTIRRRYLDLYIQWGKEKKRRGEKTKKTIIIAVIIIVI